MRDQRNRKPDRFKTIASIRFSEAGPRDLVISVTKGRIVLGQKLTFNLDGGGTSHTFMRNSPSLSVEQAEQLIDALQQGVDFLRMDQASRTSDMAGAAKEEDLEWQR